jgi:MoaA/NifB/PqqE/SkfB family radical SAM enzyme
MYGPLVEVTAAARSYGLLTTITSNGMLLTPRLLGGLAPHLDLLAISLDGRPESHNRMRGSALAFTKMSRRLEHVRASGIPFGFIFTLTQRNLDELDWVADFAVAAGASLLQVHPLEEVGRAVSTLRGERPDAIERMAAYVAVRELQERVGESLRIQLDIVDLRLLEAHPASVYAGDDAGTATAPLADVVSPLVIEADGRVVPLSYGFAAQFAFGNLHDRPLSDLGREWRRRHLAEFQALCRATLVSMNKDPATGRFANWYEEIGVIAVGAAAV